ncbi:MAG: hypothetical protein ABIJ21_00630 [Nanoarchaeota archaeon]
MKRLKMDDIREIPGLEDRLKKFAYRIEGMVETKEVYWRGIVQQDDIVAFLCLIGKRRIFPEDTCTETLYLYIVKDGRAYHARVGEEDFYDGQDRSSYTCEPRFTRTEIKSIDVIGDQAYIALGNEEAGIDTRINVSMA